MEEQDYEQRKCNWTKKNTHVCSMKTVKKQSVFISTCINYYKRTTLSKIFNKKTTLSFKINAFQTALENVRTIGQMS